MPAAGAAHGDGSGRAGASPPRRSGTGFHRSDDEPDDSDTDAFAAYWQRRQDALGAGDPGELLKRHEIILYEQLKGAGHDIRLIPRPDRIPGAGRIASNDLWLNADGSWRQVEAKSFENPQATYVGREIADSVTSARDNHGVVKDTFIIYSRGREPRRNFVSQMARYNQRHTRARIERLYFWSGATLIPIGLLPVA